jgi:hypothetical protein
MRAMASCAPIAVRMSAICNYTWSPGATGGIPRLYHVIYAPDLQCQWAFISLSHQRVNFTGNYYTLFTIPNLEKKNSELELLR